MSKTFDFTLPASQGGGKLVSFTYSKSLGELVGTWSAEVAEGSFTAGGSFSVPCMANGLIENAWKDPDGLWHLTGKDAGVRLLRSTPPASTLVTGSAGAVISDLAGFCDMSCVIGSSGGGGASLRSAVTGTTCAEAILEMAMLGGSVAYIDKGGALRVVSPASSESALSGKTILEDGGTSLDLDGYATHVAVVLTRRKKTIKEEGKEGGLSTHYSGTTPSGRTKDDTKTGSFRYTDQEGEEVTGSYSVTTIEPIGVLSKSKRIVSRAGVTVTIEEEHSWDIKTKTVWRGDQEHRLWAWAETGWEMKRTVEGSLGSSTWKEETTEVMSRKFSIFDALWVPSDWKGMDLDMVDEETVVRATVRTGGLEPEEGMPPYSPPFDMKTTRKYHRMDFGRGVLCDEAETRYEARQIGDIAGVTRATVDSEGNGVTEHVTIQHGGALMRLALQTHTTPFWVPIVTMRTTYERYGKDGTLDISARTEHCDDGQAWMLANGVNETGDAEADQRQKDYAKFTQATDGVDVSTEGSGASIAWQFMEQPGRVRSYVPKGASYGVSSEDWYMNGQYVPSKICPHYEAASIGCGVAGISAIGAHDGDDCPYRGRGWKNCPRAVAALEQARTEEDRPLLEPPVVGTAGSLSGKKGAPAKRSGRARGAWHGPEIRSA